MSPFDPRKVPARFSATSAASFAVLLCLLLAMGCAKSLPPIRLGWTPPPRLACQEEGAAGSLNIARERLEQLLAMSGRPTAAPTSASSHECFWKEVEHVAGREGGRAVLARTTADTAARRLARRWAEGTHFWPLTRPPAQADESWVAASNLFRAVSRFATVPVAFGPACYQPPRSPFASRQLEACQTELSQALGIDLDRFDQFLGQWTAAGLSDLEASEPDFRRLRLVTETVSAAHRARAAEHTWLLSTDDIPTRPVPSQMPPAEDIEGRVAELRRVCSSSARGNAVGTCAAAARTPISPYELWNAVAKDLIRITKAKVDGLFACPAYQSKSASAPLVLNVSDHLLWGAPLGPVLEDAWLAGRPYDQCLVSGPLASLKLAHELAIHSRTPRSDARTLDGAIAVVQAAMPPRASFDLHSPSVRAKLQELLDASRELQRSMPCEGGRGDVAAWRAYRNKLLALMDTIADTGPREAAVSMDALQRLLAEADPEASGWGMAPQLTLIDPPDLRGKIAALFDSSQVGP